MSKEFNWKKFHKDLDLAIAIWITESPAGIQNTRLPSKTPLFTFMKYSFKKTQEQNGTRRNKKV
jgi:hypothetical protein